MLNHAIFRNRRCLSQSRHPVSSHLSKLGRTLLALFAYLFYLINCRLTHGPPHGILDLAQNTRPAGCHTLLKHVQERIQPTLHVFGHIHEGHGCEVRRWRTAGGEGTKENGNGNRKENGTERENGDEDGEGAEDETVFVNAANAPTGCRARSEHGKQVPFAGPGFQPVIVDILDRPSDS